MISGVLINGQNTETTMGMIMLHDLQISDPVVKTAYVDLPGISGTLDFTDALVGYPLYEDRDVSFTLFARYDDQILAQARKTLYADYDGRVVRIETPDLPGYYWRGRVHFGAFSGYNLGQIKVAVRAEPYRLKRDVTAHTFKLAASTPLTITLENDGMPTLPTFRCDQACTLTDAAGNTYSVSANTDYTTASLMLKGRSMTITAETAAAATLTVTYQEGRL